MESPWILSSNLRFVDDLNTLRHQGEIALQYLLTQIRFAIGAEQVTCRRPKSVSPQVVSSQPKVVSPQLLSRLLYWGKQGWRSGESARLPPMWPGFNSGPVSYVGWVCCWFSSLLPVFFSGFSKFQLDQDRGPAWKPAKADAASSLNIVIFIKTTAVSLLS